MRGDKWQTLEIVIVFFWSAYGWTSRRIADLEELHKTAAAINNT